MQVHVFDVEHGFCAAVIAPSQKLLLIDCGHNASTDWRPSRWIRSELRCPIENLTITNFDEDHVSDLPDLVISCEITSLAVNQHVTVDWLRATKRRDGIGRGIETLMALMGRYTAPAPPADWGGLQIERFYHSTSVFADENALSLVTFVRYQGLSMVFPGDLTAAAWGVFLADPMFRRLLGQTNVFVASHHGRRDGYSPAVFEHCHPDIVVISDKPIVHDTQEVDYGQHARGITFDGGRIRSVLTTRNDGHLSFWTEPTGSYRVQTGG